MSKPPNWVVTLQAARDEASLAVSLFNDASQARSFEGFVVHMHLAWLYLLHAQFERDGVDSRYRDHSNPRLLMKVDGEAKRWELAQCVRHKWKSEEPVRKNVEFFIGLRNKIEHRHSRFDEYLALAVGGKSQALLLNFESELTSCFGQKWSMASVLRFPLFIGTFTEEGTKTLRDLRDKIPGHLKRFIAEFHSGLSEDIENDQKFEVRLGVILEKVNRDPAALAIEFINWDDLSEEDKLAVEELSRKGRTIIREKNRPVANHGLLRTGVVVSRVAEAIPFKFTSNDFVNAYRTQNIRPRNGSDRPERTDEKYCIYDSLNNGYGYTEAWVNRLIRKCQTAEGFEAMVGLAARTKEEGPQAESE